jgi:hypothetical protein
MPLRDPSLHDPREPNHQECEPVPSVAVHRPITLSGSKAALIVYLAALALGVFSPQRVHLELEPASRQLLAHGWLADGFRNLLLFASLGAGLVASVRRRGVAIAAPSSSAAATSAENDRRRAQSPQAVVDSAKVAG